MEQISLCQFAADLLKKLSLLFRLHPLCQRMDSHLPCDPGHGFHDAAVHAIAVVQMPQDVHVKLDQVHFKPAEHIQ